MKCADAHLAIGAEPNSLPPELERHLRECVGCAEYRREMMELDEHIHRALQLDLATLESDAPARTHVRLVAESTLPEQQPAPRAAAVRRQWALAASVLFAVAVVLVLWGALPRHSLAADVVAHVISEPIAAKFGPPSSSAPLADVLRSAHLRLDPIHDEVVFAQTCFFRGRLVPHFVVRTDQGPVTVMILPNEKVKQAERFEEGGFRGILLPDAGRGSIAVLSRSKLDAEQAAREILGALHSEPRV
jgi:hypothetical protein